MNTNKLAALGGTMVLSFGLLVGCETKSFINPSEVGRFQQDPLTVKILDQLDPGRESVDPQFANAVDVQASDLQPEAGDYVIGANDLLTVLITDVQGQGVETVRTVRVTESGNVNLPLIPAVKATGLTEAQLQQAVTDAYRQAGLVQDAQVSVTVQEARGKTFSILGSVGSPGQYAILQSDFRLLDALVLARDVTSTGIDHVYVVRKRQSEQGGGAAPGGAPAGGGTAPAPRTTDPLRPRSDAGPARDGATETAAIANTSKRVALLQTQGPAPSASTAAAGATRPAGETEGRYIIVDGKPVLVGPQGAPAAGATAQPAPAPAPAPMASAAQAPARNQPAPPPAERRGGGGFAFNAPREPSDVRVIRIPLEPLKNGELKYNIVVRPGDLIMVPSPTIGEYYMGGHVGAPGVYSLTARNITLKQAVIAARMLDELAIPKRTDIVRRVSPNEEIFVRVDLEKIFDGQQPDIFLKPDDQVMVGTNAVAPFLAAFRNAFRVTYGFGFLYDKNFADDDDDDDN
jgi:polysaccharide export outer membrane protein